MGFHNPPRPWSEIEARLRGKVLPNADGGDGPAFTRTRPGPRTRPDRAPSILVRGDGSVPYAELHCHSDHSFLDGASSPEDLVEEAVRLGIETLALTDHDGFYGIVRFAEAAREVGLGTVIGAELSLGLTGPQNGVADPEGDHLVVLAHDTDGYASLCRAISEAQLAGEKGAPHYEGGIEDLGDRAAGRWSVLTGCRKGAVPRALVAEGATAARRELRRLIAAFGRERVAVELWDHGDPLDSHRNDALVELAAGEAVRVVVSNNVHYARPADHRLATVVAAIRARRSLDELDGWLPVSPGAHLRSGAEQARRFRRYPGAVEATAALGRELAFDLQLVAPDLPGYAELPPGRTPMSHLRHLVEEGVSARHGPRRRHRPNDQSLPARTWRQIDHELAVIEELNYPGYFLIVHEIVDFCRGEDILCQGRGSAANSAVCYALGITKADPVDLGLLFERFLAPERDGPPDIDLDIESGRREEVIQHVYDRYDRHHAAQVANVITYRPRSAIRDVGKALGYGQGQVDAWSKQVSSWGRLLRPTGVTGEGAGRDEDAEAVDDHVASVDDHVASVDDAVADIPAEVVALADRLVGAPRHLGIHSGGMVLCDGPVIEVCPVERARMEDRTVLQWDKDDCAAAGLVKFDLLGLRMLSALHETIDLVRLHHDPDADLATLPQEDAVYDMLCRADAIGVFQVESRAQLATLPRLQPRDLADLAAEVAIIRPGPIQGGSVHPYIRRRRGERFEYLHDLLKPVLERTYGVPLFQEQLMQMAIAVAGFTAAEADQLRQAMGSKRSAARMERLRDRLYTGMAENGITGADADRIHDQIVAFADFGFPESHAVSFAYLVYASAWCKHHHPAAFLVGLLNNQPMGFYSPQTLVADARRHDVVVRRADVNESTARARLEPDPDVAGGVAVRLGLSPVRDVGERLAERIADTAPFTSIADLVHRTAPSEAALSSLAAAGALTSLGVTRREGLWAAGPAAWGTADRLPGTAIGVQAPQLPEMTAEEVTTADLIATGVSPESHPLEHLRDRLDEAGVVSVARLATVPTDRTVAVGGAVTHRQQPATARGTVFLNLEDETGSVNVICTPPVWERFRKVAVSSFALVVTARLERTDEVISLVATHLAHLPMTAPVAARDFR